ncbi:flagellar protein FlaG [Desulfobotulus sp. H1]|uniref:Flagellar protein FlaG n=1 Tax=Desulfobotulus pelophilus TaxID=2823377 RepID=A0ABT3N4K5_9BACT|nr:flagellar protein FlaG [Desulfobotulus pelophilus]MCW7752384.1 flagellar protein FlaG [Desulfobotulus pelophilus]
MDISASQGIRPTGEMQKIRNVSEAQIIQDNKPKSSHENTHHKADPNREKPTAKEDVEKATRDLNRYMDELKTSLGFSINEKTKELMVNIINRETKEVIKQIPPEELVTIREKMAELAGILLSERV